MIMEVKCTLPSLVNTKYSFYNLPKRNIISWQQSFQKVGDFLERLYSHIDICIGA